MPSYTEDYRAIEEARKSAGGLLSTAGSLGASADTFRDEVMANVRSARADRGISGLGQDYANTTREMATAGSDVRARTGDVNPLQTDALVARERGDILGRLSGISTAMTEQTGTIDEIIGSGTNRLKAMATLKKAEADKAKEDADVMIKMVQIKQEEDQRQFDRIMKEKELAIQGRKADELVPWNEYTIMAGIAGKNVTSMTPEELARLQLAPRQLEQEKTVRSVLDNYISKGYKIVREGGKIFAVKEGNILGWGSEKQYIGEDWQLNSSPLNAPAGANPGANNDPLGIR